MTKIAETAIVKLFDAFTYFEASMKLYVFLTATLISFSAVCDEVKVGIDVNIKLMSCLDEKIPNNAIKNPEDRTAKSLFLFPSVIENIMQINQSDGSKEQFILAMKFCSKEIQDFKKIVKTQSPSK